YATPPVDAAPQLDRGAMSATFVVSEESVDRSGDRVILSGIDLRAHARNPCVLHDHGRNGWSLPIGKSEDPATGRYMTWAEWQHRKLLGVCYCAKNNPRAEEVYRLVEAGILRGASIGYKPISSEPMPGSDPSDENPPTLLRAIELCEWSICAVPDNP